MVFIGGESIDHLPDCAIPAIQDWHQRNPIMISFSSIYKKLEIIFDTFLREYGFSMISPEAFRIELVSEKAKIVIQIDRREDGLDVLVIDPKSSKPNEYMFGFLMKFRDPDYAKGTPDYNEKLSAEDNMLINIPMFMNKLRIYCDDMLKGDFSRIKQEGYFEFMQYVRDHTPDVMRLPSSDPLNEKFWRGDYTWVDDRKRENN